MDPLFSRGSRIHANELMQGGGGYARDVYTEGGIASVENLLKFLRRVRCPRSLHSTHSFAIHNNPCIYIYIYIFPSRNNYKRGCFVVHASFVKLLLAY